MPLQGSSLPSCHLASTAALGSRHGARLRHSEWRSGTWGAMDGPGPTIVDGMLYVNSGYAQWGGLPGNVLLAFEVRNP